MGIVNSLTPAHLRTEFQLMVDQKKARYAKIAFCSGVVIGFAVAIAVIALGFFALVTAPKVTRVIEVESATGELIQKNVREIAPGYKTIFALGLFAMFFGWNFAGPLAGFAVYGVIRAIGQLIIFRLTRKVNHALEGFEHNTPLNRTALGKIFKIADDPTLKKLIPKMNISQLHTTAQLLGQKRFNQLIDDTISPEIRFHQELHSLHSHDSATIHEKIQELENRFLQLYGLAHYTCFKTIVLQELRKGEHTDTFIRWLRIWAHADIQPPPQSHNDSQIMGLESDPNIEQESISIQVESTNKKQPSTIHTEPVSCKLLRYRNPVFETLLTDGDWRSKPQFKVENPEVFKQMIDLSNPLVVDPKITQEMIRLDPKKKNEKLGRIFLYAHAYMEEFAKTLQLAFPEHELRQLLNDPYARKSYSQQRFGI